jgi:hypothetical protein
MTFAILFAVAFFAGYVVEAGIDGKRIVAHQRINHTASISIWTAIFTCASIIAASSGMYMNLTSWNTLHEVSVSLALLSIPVITCMALFSTGFRIGLNELRGLNRFYISPNSKYDYVAISFMEGEFLGQSAATRLHWHQYTNTIAYKENVHRAGSLLYLVEAIAYITGGTFTLYFTIHGS